MLEELRKKIKEVLQTEVKDIIYATRSKDIIEADEKGNGDSATIADIRIGEILSTNLPKLLPDSIVINEEDFDEEKYKLMRTKKYIWVVDPIDGTKAFRTKGNNEYCVGIGLLENLKPILSIIYMPEYEFNSQKGFLAEAIDSERGIIINDKKVDEIKINSINDVKCVCHVHRDTELNESEKKISDACKESEMIRAYDGHSTLVNYTLVALDGLNRIFTRRNANLWDVEQASYIVEKAGGKVFYNDGTDIFPIDLERLTYKVDENDNKFLIIDSNIACSKDLKEKIMDILN